MSDPGIDGLGGGGAGGSGMDGNSATCSTGGRGGDGVVVVRFSNLKQKQWTAGVEATGYSRMYMIGDETVIVFTNTASIVSFRVVQDLCDCSAIAEHQDKPVEPHCACGDTEVAEVVLRTFHAAHS